MNENVYAVHFVSVSESTKPMQCMLLESVSDCLSVFNFQFRAEQTIIRRIFQRITGVHRCKNKRSISRYISFIANILHKIGNLNYLSVI